MTSVSTTKKATCCFCLILSSLFSCQLLFSQTPSIAFSPVVTTGLTNPIDIVHAADGSNRLFVAEKDGLIRYLRGNTLIDTIFLDISSSVSSDGERGLLSIAFHPQYATNGYFFVYYTNPVGSLTLARYHVSADRNKADPASGVVLLSIPHSEFANHNGGKLNFGNDGFLYFATGDGGSGGDPHFNSQNKDTLLGKMIRIDVNGFATQAPFYSIPAGNPFAAANDQAKDEIWSLGLRNPFRWSFDRITHDMWIGDVGQNAREEVDFLPAAAAGGTNFGWRCYEANRTYNDSGCLAPSNYTFPVFDYDRTPTGGTSITGGMVYRGAAYPTLYGYYIVVDFNSGNAWLIRSDGAGGFTSQRQAGLPTTIAGFGEDEAGELYAVSLGGTIYRVQPAALLAAKLESFTLNQDFQLRWQTLSEQNQKQFEVQSGTDGVQFNTFAVVPATNTGNRKSYQYTVTGIPASHDYFRLKMVDNGGAVVYSAIIRTQHTTGEAISIAPTLIQNNQVNIQIRKAFRNLQVFDMNGRKMISKNLEQRIGSMALDVSSLPKGVYTIRFEGGSIETKKIIKR